MWRVLLPLTTPGLLSAAIFAFTLVAERVPLRAGLPPRSEQAITVPVGAHHQLIRGDVFYWGQLMAAALLGSIPVAVSTSFFVGLLRGGVDRRLGEGLAPPLPNRSGLPADGGGRQRGGRAPRTTLTRNPPPPSRSSHEMGRDSPSTTRRRHGSGEPARRAAPLPRPPPARLLQASHVVSTRYRIRGELPSHQTDRTAPEQAAGATCCGVSAGGGGRRPGVFPDPCLLRDSAARSSHETPLSYGFDRAREG